LQIDDPTRPTRNLALELVRVTEVAALSAGRLMGMGDKISADQAAVNAMQMVLNTIEMDGLVVIGEGEKDRAPMLARGQKVGTGNPPIVDFAVDPIDGTTPLARGLANSISTIAVAPRGTMFDAGPIAYMHKIAVGEVGRDVIDINDTVVNNLKRIAKAKGGNVNDLLVVILDRPRHEPLIEEIRATGARITLISDGDVAGAIMTGLSESGIDVLMGIGGCPEGVIAACAMRCMGGNIQGKLFARNVEEYKKGLELGYDFEKILTMDDLVRSEDVFFAATGITTGSFLKGIDYFPGGAQTESLVMRGRSGTIRKITARHRLSKLSEISSIKY